jgi:histone acetyltransferase (RNA polymerase elongator complex component)
MKSIRAGVTKEVEKISKENGFKNISVIPAIGTKKYYEKRGFKKDRLYIHKIT